MKAEMKLSVIVPCFNAAETIAVQLDALAAQEWAEPWEIIISNNGSTDDTLAVVERYRERLPNMRIIDASSEKGAAYAINVGARAAKGEAIAFCDADDEVAPGWIAAMGTSLEEHEFVASRFDYEKLNESWTQKRMWVVQEAGLQKTRFHPYMVHAGSCGLGIRRRLHEAVGGFDVTMPVLWDGDYCFKVQRLGTKLHFEPKATVFVRYRNDLRSAFRQARQWATYNPLLYKRYRTPDVQFPEPWKFYLRGWRTFLYKLRSARRKEDFAKCVWVLGWQIGLLQGSVKFWAPPVPI